MAESISNMSPQQFVAKQPAAQEQVPTDLVPLPSNGVTYPLGSIMANTESVAIRSMTARDEDILTSRALLKNGKAITTLLGNCIVNKNIDPGSLLAGDRNAILIGIRITEIGRAHV